MAVHTVQQAILSSLLDTVMTDDARWAISFLLKLYQNEWITWTKNGKTFRRRNRGGLVSGKALTSVLGTIVNICLLAFFNFKFNCSIEWYVLGDDVAAWGTEAEILRLWWWYNSIGYRINAQKTLLSYDRLSFLKKLYIDGTVHGSLPRSISSCVQHDPDQDIGLSSRERATAVRTKARNLALRGAAAPLVLKYVTAELKALKMSELLTVSDVAGGFSHRDGLLYVASWTSRAEEQRNRIIWSNEFVPKEQIAILDRYHLPVGDLLRYRRKQIDDIVFKPRTINSIARIERYSVVLSSQKLHSMVERFKTQYSEGKAYDLDLPKLNFEQTALIDVWGWDVAQQLDERISAKLHGLRKYVTLRLAKEILKGGFAVDTIAHWDRDWETSM